MRDALHLQVTRASGTVIQQQHGGRAPRKELLQVQNLPPVAQGRLREHTHLGQ